MKFTTGYCHLQMSEEGVQLAIEANAVQELHDIIKLLRQFEDKWCKPKPAQD